MSVWLFALGSLALAGDSPLQADLGGDVKSFGVATFPYDNPLMPPEPFGQGVWDLRLKGNLKYGDHLRAEVHHAVTTTLGGSGAAVNTTGTGINLAAPEAIDLTWEPDIDGDALYVVGRTARLNVTASAPGMDLTVGRQAVAFGNGLFFTPLDLISPFTPSQIDNEYKPGVDALRVDGYWGTTGRVTAVTAYAGDWTYDGTISAVYGQGTVGVTDIGGFLGAIYGDTVIGTTLASGVGPVGLHADATYTLPNDDAEDPFVRAVGGATYLPTPTTTLSGELYLQTFGGSDPSEYLEVALSERFSRSEVWSLGRTYAALAVGQQITPIIQSNVGLVMNLEDPSMLVAPSLAWSAGNNTSVSVGAYVGIGERPDLAGLNSEFGLYPSAVFTQMSAYF